MTEAERWHILTQALTMGMREPVSPSDMTEIELYEPCELEGERFDAGIYRRPDSARQ